MKSAEEEAVDAGHRPRHELVDRVPPRREDLQQPIYYWNEQISANKMLFLQNYSYQIRIDKK